MVQYTVDGRPVETLDWVHEVKPEDESQTLDKDPAVRPDHSILLPIPGDVLFEFGKADLTFPTGADVLAKAGVLIDQRAGDYRRVSIEGHTESVGSTAFNKHLSKRRAETVQAWHMNYLVARKKSLK